MIDFTYNQIEIIHKNTFNSFTNFSKVTEVYLDDKIKGFHPKLFKLFKLFNRLVR